MVWDKCRQIFEENERLHMPIDCTLQQLRPPVNIYFGFHIRKRIDIYTYIDPLMKDRYRQTIKQTNVFPMAHTLFGIGIDVQHTHTHTQQ